MSEFDASVPDRNLPHPDGDSFDKEPILSPGVLLNQSDPSLDPRVEAAMESPATSQQQHPTSSGLDLDQNEDSLALGYPNSPPDTPVQIRLYRQDQRLMVALPAEVSSSQDPGTSFTWADLRHQLQHRLNSSEPFWQADMAVCLVVRDRLLDEDQLQTIADILTDANLRLQSVETNRRLTAIIAATAGYSVDQQNLTPPSSLESEPSLAEPLYLQTTLRSGVEICHPGSVIIYGDTNPGSSIVAHGDVLVWGRLRGNAHAGATGNVRACIMTLQLEPPAQLRIAAYRARAPKPLAQFHPEVAYITNQTIRIARATDFSRRI